jgi:hypothetical protein
VTEPEESATPKQSQDSSGFSPAPETGINPTDPTPDPAPHPVPDAPEPSDSAPVGAKSGRGGCLGGAAAMVALVLAAVGALFTWLG